MPLRRQPFSLRSAAGALCLWLGAVSPAAADVTVFAAASLKTALDAVLARFENETGIGSTASYAGSSVLARQIQLGAPADLFISASPEWMDVLEADGALVPGTRRDLLGNRLVVIAHGADAAAIPLDALPGALGPGRLAMALVDAVPAGIYGKQALENAGVWAGLAPRVAQTDNVRAALALVATGAAPFGIVYATDARADPRVSIVTEIPTDLHDAITYPIAQIAGRGDETGARRARAFLAGPEAAALFRAQGFMVLTE